MKGFRRKAANKNRAGAFSEKAVSAQLRRLYRDELRQMVGELRRLTPAYRARVGEQTFAASVAIIERVNVLLRDDASDIDTLASSLEALLEQRRALVNVLN